MTRRERLAWSLAIVFSWFWYLTLFKLTSARSSLNVYESGLKLKASEAFLAKELRDSVRGQGE